MTGALARVHEVSKNFGDVVALNDVSFSLGPGVTALLGPNGAGKSTIIRLLCGLTSPSQGSVSLLGVDPRRDTNVFRQLGFVTEHDALFEAATAREFVALAARLNGVDDPDGASHRALGVVGLAPTDDRRLKTYSKGMRQRAKIAQAIVHDPQVLFLDEPLNALDPRQRLEMIDVFRGLGEMGKCVLISSHVLEEVERIGSNVLVLSRGRLAAEGDYRQIRELLDHRPHRIRVRSDDDHKLSLGLIADRLCTSVSFERDGLLIETPDAGAFRRSLAAVAKDRGVRLYEMAPLDEDLESVFDYVLNPR